MPGADSRKEDWTPLCAEAALGGLAALAVVRDGDLVRDPDLRRLLGEVAREAAAAARSAGRRLSADPASIAARRCRKSPQRRHPWLTALRRGRRTGAERVFGPLLAAARAAGAPAPRLGLIAAVLARLERTP
ncbi:MAG: ketopantoate reductase C-terminal domain-containing protein [Elusimicrobia bacterium]|nr:ketopantoate reductase C-terminal domain-containing protein [Elusimicrobiota bacterium]